MPSSRPQTFPRICTTCAVPRSDSCRAHSSIRYSWKYPDIRPAWNAFHHRRQWRWKRPPDGAALLSWTPPAQQRWCRDFDERERLPEPHWSVREDTGPSFFPACCWTRKGNFGNKAGSVVWRGTRRIGIIVDQSGQDRIAEMILHYGQHLVAVLRRDVRIRWLRGFCSVGFEVGEDTDAADLGWIEAHPEFETVQHGSGARV